MKMKVWLMAVVWWAASGTALAGSPVKRTFIRVQKVQIEGTVVAVRLVSSRVQCAASCSPYRAIAFTISRTPAGLECSVYKDVTGGGSPPEEDAYQGYIFEKEEYRLKFLATTTTTPTTATTTTTATTSSTTTTTSMAALQLPTPTPAP